MYNNIEYVGILEIYGIKLEIIVAVGQNSPIASVLECDTSVLRSIHSSCELIGVHPMLE